MARERLERTNQRLREERAVRVDELAELCGVTLMTIRRDLDKLVADNHHIRRCRGGAVMVTNITAEESYPSKLVLNLEEKQEIAKRAHALLEPGQLLYLDAGTTCYEVARLLTIHPIPLDVVTNDLHTASLLSENGYHVFLTGGTVEESTGCLIGDFAEDTIKHFCFDVALIGATSIDENFEVSTPTIEKVALKQLILSRSRRAWLLVDHTKFFHHSHYAMYSLEDFDAVFTSQEFIEKNAVLLLDKKIVLK